MKNETARYLFIDHKHLNPNKDASSSFGILTSFPEMNYPKLQLGISWSWWNLTEEKRRRSLPGDDCCLFCHGKGMDLRIWEKDCLVRVIYSLWREHRELGCVSYEWVNRVSWRDIDITEPEVGCGELHRLLNWGFIEEHWRAITVVGSVKLEEFERRRESATTVMAWWESGGLGLREGGSRRIKVGPEWGKVGPELQIGLRSSPYWQGKMIGGEYLCPCNTL